VLIALNRQTAITRAFAVTAVFNLVANLLLVPRLGIVAAAASTIASELVLYAPFHRVLRTELPGAGISSLLWRPATAAAACGAVVFLLRDQEGAAVVAGGLAYGAVLWLLATFTDEDRRLVERLLGRTG